MEDASGKDDNSDGLEAGYSASSEEPQTNNKQSEGTTSKNMQPQFFNEGTVKKPCSQFNIAAVLERKSFEMIRPIGAGAGGRVYFGELTLLGAKNKVAIKEFHATADKDGRQQKIFEHEGNLLATCSHINIARLFGMCFDKETCYLVMEYAPGGSLNQFLKSQSLDPTTIADWGMQIARGMKYLHHEQSQASIIHRDLKSNNILLAKVDSDGNPILLNNILKIADFGLARHFVETVEMTTAGTFAWMAPEVIRSSKFSRGSDVWSFGVVVWELLTSQTPYAGINMYSVAYSIGLRGCTLPIPESCPIEIKSILQQCWTVDAKERPSFARLVQKFQELQSSEFSRRDSNSFSILQKLWRAECEEKFLSLKRTEEEIEKQQRELETLQDEQRRKQKELDDKEELLSKREQNLLLQERFLNVYAGTDRNEWRRSATKRRPKNINPASISEPRNFRILASYNEQLPDTIPLEEANKKFGCQPNPVEARALVLDNIYQSTVPPHKEWPSPPSSNRLGMSGMHKSPSEPCNIFGATSQRPRRERPRRMPSFLGGRRFWRRTTINGNHVSISQPDVVVHLSTGFAEAVYDVPRWLQLTTSPEEAERQLLSEPIGTFNISRRLNNSRNQLVLTVKYTKTEVFQENIHFHDGVFRLGDRPRIQHSSLSSLVRHYQTFPFTTINGCPIKLGMEDRNGNAHQACPSMLDSSDKDVLVRSGARTITSNRVRSASESQLLMYNTETLSVADLVISSTLERSASLESLINTFSNTGASSITQNMEHSTSNDDVSNQMPTSFYQRNSANNTGLGQNDSYYTPIPPPRTRTRTPQQSTIVGRRASSVGPVQSGGDVSTPASPLLPDLFPQREISSRRQGLLSSTNSDQPLSPRNPFLTMISTFEDHPVPQEWLQPESPKNTDH